MKDTRINEFMLKDYFTKECQFLNEKLMCNYIEKNIELFCNEVLEDEYIYHQREQKIFNRHGRYKTGTPNARFDFFISCKNNRYVLEVKNPRNIFSEMSRAVGQMMMYDHYMHKLNIDAELIMISSVHSEIFLDLVKSHKLPYGYVLFNKHHSARLIGYDR